jgi:thiol:disulfide interchange protein
MFDILSIDFTRFRKGNTGVNSTSRVGFFTVFFMGGVSALLAGACVAPVVIAVVVSASKAYASGNSAGLLLPFLLGLGMALPWPFAGAGLSLLPKPGNWMNRVKQVFGVLILLFAVYYGYLGVKIWNTSRSLAETTPTSTSTDFPQEEGWFTSLSPALSQAKREGKPVFIDFWATWCKNCSAMDATTFRDPAVQARLEDFVKVKFQAESEEVPGVRETLEYFQCIGLPTYVILTPKS